MHKFVGVDGFRKGWVVVSINGRGDGKIAFFRNISELRKSRFDLAMIDIPIGLPESGNRTCDIDARRLLGKHCNRVFTGARRPLLNCKTPKEANRVGRSLKVNKKSGAGVSLQLYHLLNKIKEADLLVCRVGQAKLRECHPELVFRRLGKKEVPSKHEPKGLRERRKLLPIRNLDELIAARLGKGAKEDDVLDACACAIAARDAARKAGRFLPEGQAPTDKKHLKMQIWF